jgi:pyrroloquinoline quinone biosynthesis protein B
VRLRVLGSAAGGGVPQWNCACPNCVDARTGAGRVEARTQDSVAVSAGGQEWVLLNASPDVTHQLQSFPALWPRSARSTGLTLVLTNGDIDHCLGLLLLREWTPLVVYATRAVRVGLKEGNTLLRTLERYPGQLTWYTLELEVEQPLRDVRGEATGMFVTAFALPGKPPVHLSGLATPSPEDNVGLEISDRRSSLVYAPGLAHPALLVPRLSRVDCALVDGTFWSQSELIDLGLSQHRARDLAHWPVGGDDGTLAILREVEPRFRVLTHLNNTNPLLRSDSTERRLAMEAGWTVATDGLELTL